MPTAFVCIAVPTIGTSKRVPASMPSSSLDTRNMAPSGPVISPMPDAGRFASPTSYPLPSSRAEAVRPVPAMTIVMGRYAAAHVPLVSVSSYSLAAPVAAFSAPSTRSPDATDASPCIQRPCSSVASSTLMPLVPNLTDCRVGSCMADHSPASLMLRR